jgi:hypothetical protein
LSAVAASIRNFASGAQNPVDAVFALINSLVPIVISGGARQQAIEDQRSPVYGPMFRQLYEIAHRAM